MASLWPWLALAGLGAFHGLNPAMGWLFAVALGRHRRSFRIVLLALLPIALGHAAAVAATVAAVLALAIAIDLDAIKAAAGGALIAWAGYHALWGHRHRVHVGMQTGMAGLALWAFLMATAHGAGLMLVPALVPLCLAGSPAGALTADASIPVALAAVGVHTAAMLAVTAALAAVVYQSLGLASMRHHRFNLDLLWTVALAAAGVWLLLG